MELDKLKLKNVLYFMESFVITVGKTEFSVPRTMIQGLNVEKNFEDSLYPLYYVSAQVPLWLYEQMTKTPDDVRVLMNLQYTLAEDVDTAQAGNTPLISEITGKFYAYIPYTTQIADASEQNQISKDSKTFNKTYEYSEGATVEMALYNEAAYKASFNQLNAILSNASPADALAYCLNKCDIKNVIMDKSTNNKTYSQFVILPESGMENMLRIVDEFKLHNNGTILFFDLVDSYVIDKTIGCKSWKNNEHKCVYIVSTASFSDTLSKFAGIHIDNTKKFTVVTIDEEGFTTYRPDSSPLLKKQKNMDFLTINTSNAILSAFTPNKEYQFSVDEISANKYNGKYRIYSLVMNCSSRGEFLDPVFQITFRK